MWRQRWRLAILILALAACGCGVHAADIEKQEPTSEPKSKYVGHVVFARSDPPPEDLT